MVCGRGRGISATVRGWWAKKARETLRLPSFDFWTVPAARRRNRPFAQRQKPSSVCPASDHLRSAESRAALTEWTPAGGDGDEVRGADRMRSRCSGLIRHALYFPNRVLTTFVQCTKKLSERGGGPPRNRTQPAGRRGSTRTRTELSRDIVRRRDFSTSDFRTSPFRKRSRRV